MTPVEKPLNPKAAEPQTCLLTQEDTHPLDSAAITPLTTTPTPPSSLRTIDVGYVAAGVAVVSLVLLLLAFTSLVVLLLLPFTWLVVLLLLPFTLLVVLLLLPFTLLVVLLLPLHFVSSVAAARLHFVSSVAAAPLHFVSSVAAPLHF
eukprot:4908346-Pyramimonas_sp.AAC.1